MHNVAFVEICGTEKLLLGSWTAQEDCCHSENPFTEEILKPFNNFEPLVASDRPRTRTQDLFGPQASNFCQGIAETLSRCAVMSWLARWASINQN